MAWKTKYILTERLMRLGEQWNDISPQRPFGGRVQQIRYVLNQVVHVPTTTLYIAFTVAEKCLFCDHFVIIRFTDKTYLLGPHQSETHALIEFMHLKHAVKMPAHE